MFSIANALCPTHVPAHHPCHFSRFSVVAKVNNAPTLCDYDDNETETTIEIAVATPRIRLSILYGHYTLPRHTYSAYMARLNEPPIAPQPSAETIDAGEALWEGDTEDED